MAESCKIEPEDDEQEEEIITSPKEELSEDLTEMCTEENQLCLIVFLDEQNILFERETETLGKVAARWQDKGVSIFWVDQGSNIECEEELGLRSAGYTSKSILAFKSNSSTY